MKITIFLLLTFGAVLGQDTPNVYQQHPLEAQRRSSTSYATSIVHGDKEGHAQSSVKVNLNSAHHGLHQQAHIQPYTQKSYINSGITYSQPDPIRVVEPQHIQAGIQYQQDKPHSQQLPGELQYQGLKQSTENNAALYYQGLQQQHQQRGGHGAILQYHGQSQSPTQANYHQTVAPKSIYQFNNLQPQSTHQTPTIIQKDSQPQLYNVGYSINIENSAPKLMYRLPNPQTAHSYRQQKLLNGDVITGTRKDKVEKPLGLNQVSYETKSGLGDFQFPANYIAFNQNNGPQQVQIYDQGGNPQKTKVYSDIRNTHGYTWKNLSPGVEISGYHSLESPVPNEQQQTQVHTFDHAAALGRSQGFDMSNVVDNGNVQYHQIASGESSETQSSDIAKTIAAPTSNIQYQQQSSSSDAGNNNQELDISKLLETAASNIQQPYTSSVGNSQNVELPKLADEGKPQYQPVASALQSSQLSHSLDSSQSSFNFPTLQQNSETDLFNYHSNPFRHNLVSGSNVEIDKSLLNTFYKNYKPAFYPAEVTLPSPRLPSSINLDFRHGASQPNSINLANFDHKFGLQNSKFGGVNNQFQVDPQLMMINQHYAFTQAEGLDSHQPQALNFVQSPNNDVKPVKESQEDYQGAYSEQKPIIQEANKQKDEVQKEKPLATSHASITNTGHKKYYPSGNAVLPRPYGPRALLYVPEKTYRLKTNLRPPPMIVIHQKY